jgi:hypothetical protein
MKSLMKGTILGLVLLLIVEVGMVAPARAQSPAEPCPWQQPSGLPCELRRSTS